MTEFLVWLKERGVGSRRLGFRTSYVYEAEKRAKLRPGGKNLGFPGLEVNWRGEIMDVVLKDSSIPQAKAANSVRSSDEGECVIGIYVLLLGWFSRLGNGAVICILCRRRRTLDSQDLLMFNLAISDAGISIFGYSPGIVELFHGLGKDDSWTCNVDGFLILLFGLITINTLTAISLLHFLKGCRPHQAHMMDKDSIPMFILIIWISAVIWSAAPINLMTLCFPFFIPVIIMIYCYVSVIRAIHDATKVHMLGIPVDVPFVICTSFVLAWSPYAVLAMWSSCGFQLPVATRFAKSASFYNLMIYLVLGPMLQHELHSLLYYTEQKKDLPIDYEQPENPYEVKMRQSKVKQFFWLG
ncbi:opsin-5-like [Dendrobates tinctorius]|uniref:opsin-5-like n=1 Tax=Dendrobates tinctorius TaxID=92724 RepID=UPI003CC9231F